MTTHCIKHESFIFCRNAKKKVCFSCKTYSNNLCFSDNFEKYFFTVYMGVASNIVKDIGELLS